MSAEWDLNSLRENLGEILGCVFTPMPRKKVLFSGKKQDGSTMVLYSPRATLQPGGFWWVDLSTRQYEALDQGDEGLLVFRPDGGELKLMKWDRLRRELLPEQLKHPVCGEEHWSLYLYPDCIRINGGPKKIFWE